jgi:hypothetical protein
VQASPASLLFGTLDIVVAHGEAWLHTLIGREHYGTPCHRYLPGRAVMEPASDFWNFAAVPFCSHSKTIKRIVSESRHSRIQLRTIAWNKSSRGSGNHQARCYSIRIERPTRVHFSLERSDGTEFQKHHTNTQAPPGEQAGTAFRCNHGRRTTLTQCYKTKDFYNV